jgi:aldose 1-epimerase
MTKTTLLAAGLISSFCITTAQQPAPPADDLVRLANGKGMTAVFTAFGARLVRLEVPGKGGKPVNVVWGFDSTVQYRSCLTDPYYGAIIGRYGNRIAKGRFSLDGKSYQLDINNGPNSLHGGDHGFHNLDWTIVSRSGHAVTFAYRSNDGEGGYPGNLDVKVTYTLTKDNALHIAYEAQTDQPTVLNLTNHAYWNLNGPGSGDILGHHLLIYASNYLPVDSTLIPLGKLASVIGTPFDFRQGAAVGERINTTNAQLRNGRGYDHNFVLDAHDKQQAVAEVAGDKTGIRMDIFTDQPGLQFYSGNFMAGKNTMSGGFRDDFRNAFCLETQHFPDSPNEPGYPTTVLRPGQVYKSLTVYRFGLTGMPSSNE